MSKKLRNSLLLCLKLIIASVLVAWVLSQVHWDNYAIDAQTGKASIVLGSETAPQGRQLLRVTEGPFWDREKPILVPADQFVAFDDLVIRPGFVTILSQANRGLLAMSSIGFLAALMIVSVRWRFMLSIQQIHITRWESVRLTFLGQFFNLVVPGTVGGDLVKVYYVAKHTPNKAAALVSTFVDRIMGLTEMTLLGAGMMAIVLIGGLADFETLKLPLIALVFVVCGVGFVLVFLLSRRFRRVFHLQKFYRRLPIAHHIAAAGDAAHRYRENPSSLIKALGLTFIAHMCWISAIATIGLSLSMDVPWYRYFINIPMIYILGSVPLTPGGVGIVEFLYRLFFASATVGPTKIFDLAFLARFIPAVWTLPGLIVAITGPKLPPTDQIEHELGIDD